MMVGDSCDNLLANYRIFFEGMPDPVFYKYFYPTGDNTGVLWDLYHYVRGLKKDKDSDAECYYKYSEMPAGPNGGNLSYYEKDLRQMLRAVWKDTGGKAVKGACRTTSFGCRKAEFQNRTQSVGYGMPVFAVS